MLQTELVRAPSTFVVDMLVRPVLSDYLAPVQQTTCAYVHVVIQCAHAVFRCPRNFCGK